MLLIGNGRLITRDPALPYLAGGLLGGLLGGKLFKGLNIIYQKNAAKRGGR